MTEIIFPKDEPEVRRSKARKYSALCNARTRAPYANKYMALELAQQAYIAHQLPYEAGLSSMDRYPADRFTWFCDETGDADCCLKIRDELTGKIAVWPHF